MDKLYGVIASQGKIKTATKLDQLGDEWFTKSKKPRPIGYAACTRVGIGGKLYDTLLDYGATVGALPEEVVMIILAECADVPEEVAENDDTYPLVALEKYEEASILVGIDNQCHRIYLLFLLHRQYR